MPRIVLVAQPSGLADDGRQMISRELIGLVVAVTFAGVTGYATPSVTLGWNGTSLGAQGGYRIYQGLTSQNYSAVTDVGKSTNATIAGVVPGRTYYFAITDYNTNGVESTLSSEIAFTVPNVAIVQVATAKGKSAVLSGIGPAGYKYDVQAASSVTNSAKWTVLGSVTVSSTNTFQFTDAGSVTNRSRFYRLHQTYP